MHSLGNATESIAAGFHALSDPIRLKILEQLRQQEQCVCDLNNELQIAQSRLSFHLRVLKEAQLVQARQEGRWVYYRLNPTQMGVLAHYLQVYEQTTPLPSPTCL